MAVETQEQILDAVQAVIVRDGVRGATMRQVAQEADVSLGLISYHFDGKDSLILAAFDRATRRLLAESHAALQGVDDPAERVRAFLRGAFIEEFLEGDYLRLRISLWAVALTDSRIGELDKRFFDEYEAAYRALIAKACPGLGEAELGRRSIDSITMSNGVWLNWARYRDAEDLEQGLLRSEALALG